MAGKRATSSILVLLLPVFFFHLVTMASSESESEILLKFKESLKNVGPISGWAGPGQPCSGWPGVICGGGRVWGLKLEKMGLGGTIDVDSLSKLTGLRTVSLMNNELDGPLPKLSKLGALKSIYLSNNKFSGKIAADTFDGMMSLKKLHLANNRFTGKIPVGLTGLPKLVELRLENNAFEGEIPDFPQERLRAFNVSDNQLVGEIPRGLGRLNASSFSGNLDLCGAPLAPCPTKKCLPLVAIIVPTVLVAVVVAALIAVVVILRRRRKNLGASQPDGTPTAAKDRGDSGDLDRMERGQGSASPGRPGVRLTFLREGGDRFDMPDLLKASAEVLGSGSCGSTYKAALGSGKVMVVKRFRQMTTASREEFNEHMRRLGRLGHNNVLPVIAFYYRKEEKLLVAEYVPNASLAAQLHGNRSNGQPTLDWPTRLNIIKGVARGLQYLYHELPSLTAPHGHLKSSNVLLDFSFNPLLTDYGLLPIINPDHAHSNTTSHKSPEANSSGGRITKKSDIWCLGILILETLTGKSPWEGEPDLAAWAAAASSEALDPEVVGPAYRGEMTKLLRVGLSCCQVDPNARPEIKEVVEKIDEVKEKEGDEDFYSSYASEADSRSLGGLSEDFKTVNI
ncbi:leucine-rich repeat protein kinase family protein [Striga asiatica]|uniref:Leucine-rich repeat protein kinase family protein n=1 Tax=Striga asiatica TaxID=4170 RepID=A0A5A7QG94_STRAF|nr:leucine-rich repeat protein kinase family protein [Striga asiatica]